MKKTEKNIISWILVRFVIWRVFLLAVSVYALAAISFKPSFPYWETILEPNAPSALWGWANFDGVHYLTIAKEGYSAQFTQAFFPLYPLLIRLFSHLVSNSIYAGLLISHFCFFISLLLLYKLVRMDRGESTAKKTIIYLLVFPTSFFFISLYSESLFLMLLLTAFYSARKRNWWLAGIAGALASATRLFGIFILPALLFEWYYLRGKKTAYSISELFSAILPILISGLGLFSYMYYLYKTYADPLLFLHVQPAFGAERSADKLILIYQVFWRYAKMLTSVDISSLLYYSISLEVISGALFLLLSLLAFRYTRISFAVFAILSYITPTLTGTFSSMPRYVLIIFPCFLILSLIKNRRFQRLWWMVSVILLAINTALFFRGYWVA